MTGTFGSPIYATSSQHEPDVRAPRLSRLLHGNRYAGGYVVRVPNRFLAESIWRMLSQIFAGTMSRVGP